MKAIITYLMVVVLVVVVLGLMCTAHSQGNSQCAQFCHHTFRTSAAGECTSQAARGYGPCYICGPAQSGAIHIDACSQGTNKATCCTQQAPKCVGGNCVSTCPNDAPLLVFPGLPQCQLENLCVSTPSECCQLCRTTRFTSSEGAGCEGHPCDAYYVTFQPPGCGPNKLPYLCNLWGFQGGVCPTFSPPGQGTFVSYCMASL